MSRPFVIDAGGDARLIKRVFVVDGGGETRLVKRAFVIDGDSVARQFLTGVVLSLAASYSVSGSSIAPAPAQASLGLLASGIIQTIDTDNGTINAGTWIDDVSAVANYEALVTITLFGPIDVGTVGSWVNLGSDQSWSIGVSGFGGGSQDVVFTLDIREVGTTAVLATTTVDLHASQAPE